MTDKMATMLRYVASKSCLDATDLKLSQLIWPAARGRRSDELIRLWVSHIPYSFRDVYGLSLASAQNTEYKAPSSFTSHESDRRLSFCWWKPILNMFGLPIWGSNPGPSAQQSGIQPQGHSAALDAQRQNNKSGRVCDSTALFGIFFSINKHRNLKRLRLPIFLNLTPTPK